LIDTGQIGTRPVEAADEAELHRVTASREHDWNRRGRVLRSARRRGVARKNNGYLTANQVGRQCGHSIEVTLRKAIFECHILTLDETGFV
jgi:hypothetical protein